MVESFLPAADLARLLGLLAPVDRIRLGPLLPEVVRRYFARLSAERGLGWSAAQVAAVAGGTGGSPLVMRLAVERLAEGRR